MYTFRINYLDNHHDSYSNIEKVQYSLNGEEYNLSGENIFNNTTPITCDLHLFTESKHYIISLKDVVRVDISKSHS